MRIKKKTCFSYESIHFDLELKISTIRTWFKCVFNHLNYVSEEFRITKRNVGQSSSKCCYGIDNSIHSLPTTNLQITDCKQYSHRAHWIIGIQRKLQYSSRTRCWSSPNSLATSSRSCVMPNSTNSSWKGPWRNGVPITTCCSTTTTSTRTVRLLWPRPLKVTISKRKSSTDSITTSRT